MRNEKSHPAYGMAGFHRISGYPGNLFGTSVDCENYIELEISPGVEIDDDCYHSYDSTGVPYIRVAFSPAQFADLLTSMNISKGVPCTIRRINNKAVEKIPDDLNIHELDRQKQKYKEYMQQRLKQLKESQKMIEELLEQPRLNKEDKEKLKKVLFKSIQDASSNVNFFMETFQEATDNIIQEAKAEIDATVQHCVMTAGVKALGMEFKSNELPCDCETVEIKHIGDGVDC